LEKFWKASCEDTALDIIAVSSALLLSEDLSFLKDRRCNTGSRTTSLTAMFYSDFIYYFLWPQ
jgi:hypothetical protein